MNSVPRDLDGLGISDMFATRLKEAVAGLGRFNLAVFGKTGAGKSTLINAVFGSEVAPTGMGESVTRGLNYYPHAGGTFGLYDSEGFETGVSGDAILAGLQQFVSGSRADTADRHIHAVWYVVRWSDRRFEVPQQSFVRGLAAMGLPVIMVVTQVPTRVGHGNEGTSIHPDAQAFAAYLRDLNLPLSPDNRVILTNAQADPFTDAAVFGVTELLEATYEVVPQVATAALTAVQILDWERKRQAVRRIIRQSVVVAGGVGATPIPFSDAAVLVPTHVTMIARITAAYGLPADRSRTLAAAAAVVLTGGATMAGRYLAGTLLKFVPGGAVAGSAISGAVAGSLTQAVGTAWARVCEHALSLPPEEREAFLAGPGPRDLFVAAMKRKPGRK